MHMHRTRHTFARIVAQDSGSMVETQKALGHRNIKTTAVYVQSVGVLKDGYSKFVMRRIKKK